MASKKEVAKVKATVTKQRKRPREVQVVSCQSSFPISTKTPDPNHPSVLRAASKEESQLKKDKRRREKEMLDWHDTAKEVRALGATKFIGKQKRNYQDEHYKQLTGRDKKKHQVPLPIVRGIKKKAAEREARELQEAKESGLILPSQTVQAGGKKAKVKDKSARIHGPAPTIGFMKKGMFSYKEPKK
jgi:hypothetical protein